MWLSTARIPLLLLLSIRDTKWQVAVLGWDRGVGQPPILSNPQTHSCCDIDIMNCSLFKVKSIYESDTGTVNVKICTVIYHMFQLRATSYCRPHAVTTYYQTRHLSVTQKSPASLPWLCTWTPLVDLGPQTS